MGLRSQAFFDASATGIFIAAAAVCPPAIPRELLSVFSLVRADSIQILT